MSCRGLGPFSCRKPTVLEFMQFHAANFQYTSHAPEFVGHSQGILSCIHVRVGEDMHYFTYQI